MKPPAPYFISYAHADASDLKRFREVLEPLLKASATHAFAQWTDHQILPGEHWRVEIDSALARSCFGLLLLSPSFLASPFIIKNELSPLLEKPRVVPVELHRLLFDGTMDLKGLENRQIFRDSKGKSFDACRTPPDRRNFALELYGRIDAILKKYPCEPPS